MAFFLLYVPFAQIYDLVDMFQDESMLIWYYGKDEKHLELCNVTKIIPGQRTVSLLNFFLTSRRCLCK